MDGHNLRRAGRIEEAIEEFSAADALETAYFSSEKIPVEYDWHYQHNLDLLATSYQYIGQMRKAEELFKRSFGIPSTLLVQEFNKREWPVFLLARGRAQEALTAANTMAAHRSPVVSATGHVEAGRARLALGQFKEAADEGNAALRLMRGTEGAGIVADSLQAFQGEFFLRTGKAPQGRPMLEEVVRKVRARTGPDAGAVHDRGHRASCARRRRLGTGRVDGASDGGTRSELRGFSSGDGARRRTCRRCASRPRRTGTGREILEERGSRSEEVVRSPAGPAEETTWQGCTHGWRRWARS
jgi:tetratricopeptide (TPR) repeat protein